MSLPKGKGERFDNGPLDNAIREWYEETNLPPDNIDWLGDSNEPFVDKYGVHYFAGYWHGRSPQGNTFLPSTSTNCMDIFIDRGEKYGMSATIQRTRTPLSAPTGCWLVALSAA
jgi:ADP-ribose pyrophosphatase YjhB (NUDIX family)